MPIGDTPPVGILSQSVFDAVHAMTYDTTNKCFLSGSTQYFLFVEKSSTSELPQWNYGTAADADYHNNPRGQISSTVYDILKNGSYNADGSVSRSMKKYRFRLERDANGVDQVAAVQV
jgi:hypothetical protein